ncbi:acyl-CoA dehydrogenase family protein [Rhodovulum sp. DZ06]|uniref:acyl-CoA dehydrogenase family protein n=1 Tax=Rhodovulum sp. DZ06 TaxID=3425126 RepID=UPI003D329C9D
MNMSATPPTAAEAISAAADALLPLVRERAHEAEALGQLTDDVVRAMRDAGLFTMLYPEEVGGAEITHYEAMLISEKVAHAHASAGWYIGVNNMEGAAMALYIDQAGVDRIFKDGVDITIAGNGVPRGFARKVGGGYEIWGQWAYGSGIAHAEWIHTGCFVVDEAGEMIMGEGGPEVVICHHPRETVELKGNWDVLGLRATGSFDYRVAEGETIFVPDDMVYGFDVEGPQRGKLQGAIGLAGFSAWAHSTWAIGVGRRMLDELRDVITARRDAFGPSAESASFKFQFAQAEAKYRAARALALETWKDASDTLSSGQPLAQEQMTMIKLALRHVHDVISETATFAHRSARGASLHKTAMQRTYRDIHAGAQHILMADQIVEECGRGLLGVADPEAPWTVFGIADGAK